jgi:hypothetical protein
MKHLLKKKAGARKNRPEDADASTPPSEKKKKIKDEETEAAAPDIIPSIPAFFVTSPRLRSTARSRGVPIPWTRLSCYLVTPLALALKMKN